MVQSKVRITYRNTDGQGIVITKQAPFKGMTISGFGTPDNTVSSQSLFGVDGAQLTSSTLNVRDIEVVMLIMAQSFEELQDLKRTVIRIMNPKLAGTLIYEVLDKTYEIDVIPLGGVDEGDANTSLTQKSVLQFRALDPYWRDRSEYNKLVSLSQVENMFKFPLSITSAFKFAQMKPGELVTIENTGDAAVGGIFTMQFIAPVTNPRIYEVESQNYFGFNATFNAGDVIVFNTIRNEKKVTYTPVDGVAENGMGLRMPGSTFLQLDQGVTNFQVQADEGVEGIVASLDYSPLVLGV
jgi:hypothetical protein